MPARLVFLTGSRAGTAVEVGEQDVTIGRKSDRAVAFQPNEVLVSSEHATLLYRDGQYVLRDDDSRNGTYVNGSRIKEQVIAHGDVLQFGAEGPGARFLLGDEPEVAQTLDPRTMKAAADILAMTKPAQSRPTVDLSDTFSSKLTTTRELVALAYKRSKRTRRALVTVSLLSVVAIVSLVVLQQRSRSELEAVLEDLSAALSDERAAGAALERDLVGLRAQYDSLDDIVEEEQRQLAANPRFDPDAVRDLAGGVALLVFEYGYGERDGSDLLRYVIDGNGEVVTTATPDGRVVPSITMGGGGPPLSREGTATGFLIDSSGYLITNRHVAAPWERDEELELMQARGLPVAGRFIDARAYFPPGGRSFPIVVERVSDEADVALLRLLRWDQSAPTLPLAAESLQSRAGDELVFVGYPTGVFNLLFRVEEAERATILRVAQDDSRKLADELATRSLIQPLITNGRVSDATSGEVIHSATTTVGGSGGPLIDLHQRVVAVHYASVRSPAPGDLFQTQRAVPIAFAWKILPQQVLQSIRP